MNKIVVCGDIHGNPMELSFRRKPALRELDESDVVVFCGDWGLVFGGWNKKEEAYNLNWLNNQKYKSIVIFGNHDDYLWAESLPEVEAFGTTMKACVHEGITYENIFIVDNWAIADICGSHCLLIAHAQSHDIWPCVGTESGYTVLNPETEGWLIREWRRKRLFYRVLNKSWWPQEKLDVRALEDFLVKNNAYEQHFDYIFTHDCLGMYAQYGLGMESSNVQMTEQESYFNVLGKYLNFDIWFHGHMHRDLFYPGSLLKSAKISGTIICLYDNLFSLGKNKNMEVVQFYGRDL